jgi:hypothetical protein
LQYAALPQELRQGIEEIPYSTFIDFAVSGLDYHFIPQSHWLSTHDIKVLNFGNFDSELEKLVEEWGGTKFTPIRENCGFSVTSEKYRYEDGLEEKIKARYYEDYKFKPIGYDYD